MRIARTKSGRPLYLAAILDLFASCGEAKMESDQSGRIRTTQETKRVRILWKTAQNAVSHTRTFSLMEKNEERRTRRVHQTGSSPPLRNEAWRGCVKASQEQR